ncbi:hypothetical protein [Peterkaempfera sp. SMS 1(5)a]|uniref:hypothetical protein n=1 Tax=Peterkaempfera podocarpi TaxID=3232308 RepID=UPI00366A887F
MVTPAPAVPAIQAWPPLAGPAAAVAPALLEWAARDDAAMPRLCLVTGGPGSGKSHLLAWLLAGSDSDPRTTVHATVPARGQIAETLAWEFGHQLGYGPLSADELLARVAADPRPLRFLLPDLHAAGRGPTDLPAARPQDAVERLVGPLLALPHVRAAVEVGALDLLPAEGALVLALGPHRFGPGTLPVPAQQQVYDPSGSTVGPAMPAPAGSAQPAAGTAPADEPGAEPGAPIDWRKASRRSREEALDTALAEGRAGELLKDPGFLLHGSLSAITATLADHRIPLPSRLRGVWQQAAPALSTPGLADSARAAILHLAALGADARLAELLRPLAETHRWTARWYRPSSRPTAAVLTAGPAQSVDRLVTVDATGRVRLHRVSDGELIGRVTADPRLRPVGLAAVTDTCALALDADGMLHPLLLGEESMAPGGVDYLALYHNGMTAAPSPADRLTALGAHRDRVVLADIAGTVHLWSLSALDAGPRTIRLHRSGVTATTCHVLPEVGVVLVVSAGLDGAVRLWDSATGAEMPVPVERRAAVPTAVTMAETAAGLLLAVAWSDRQLHVWQLSEGRMAPLSMLHPVDTLMLCADGTLVAGGRKGTCTLRLNLDQLWS